MEYLLEHDKKWIDECWQKLDKKMSVVSVRSRNKLPFSSDDSMHDDMRENNINCWTNGFWPGIMWLMYVGTNKQCYRTAAESGETALDAAFANHSSISHDVGFIWKLASWPDYVICKNEASKKRLSYAADFLMARYNPQGEFIRAWNHGEYVGQKAGWTIIDTMLNLPLLYWASDEYNDPRFRIAAEKHADNTMLNHIRADGSVKHIVIHNPFTGEIMDDLGGQGYEKGSSWARGQAWALYGFVLSYIHTGRQVYLDTAKRVAHYFISCVCGDWLTRCDFRAPKQPVVYDSSAGVCAACGLIEIAKAVSDNEKNVYIDAAMNILKATEKNFCDWSDNTDYILSMASGAYVSDIKRMHKNIIFADYYFAEALYKLKGFEPLFW